LEDTTTFTVMMVMITGMDMATHTDTVNPTVLPTRSPFLKEEIRSKRKTLTLKAPTFTFSEISLTQSELSSLLLSSGSGPKLRLLTPLSLSFSP